MRIVIDTNIAFSAILNSNSRISKIILQPKSKLNFYSTDNLNSEIEEHKDELMKYSRLSEVDFRISRELITRRIKFIDVEIIPLKIYSKVLSMTSKIDIDDTEFVALTEHIKGRLWTGDKKLISGLKKFNWDRFILTSELYETIKA